VGLLDDTLSVRAPTAMPPLLQRLSERKPEILDYMGVSYGITSSLLRFWKRAGFIPLYIRQTTSELTGEHSCVMVRGLNNAKEQELDWLREFSKGKLHQVTKCSHSTNFFSDFRRRFLSLLSFKFREFGSIMSLSILEGANQGLRKTDGEQPNSEYRRDTRTELQFT